MPESLVFSSVGILAFAFAYGLQHATDYDHLAAVSTIVAERKSLWLSAIVGGVWGIGHTVSLLIAGVFVLLLDYQINEQTERFLEFCVGLMLIFLGANVLRKLWFNKTSDAHPHVHRDHSHVYSDSRADNNSSNSRRGFSFSPRALIVGMIHGLAGSAALMLLVIPTIDSRSLGLLYIIIFGVGSIGGMMLMSLLIGLPLQLTATRGRKLHLVLQCVAGLLSVVLGLSIVYENTLI